MPKNFHAHSLYIGRCSLNRDVIYMLSLRYVYSETAYSGLYKEVVLVNRWFLLRDQFNCTLLLLLLVVVVVVLLLLLLIL